MKGFIWLLLPLTLTGCSRDPIVGTWGNPSGTVTMAFRSDRDFIWTFDHDTGGEHNELLGTERQSGTTTNMGTWTRRGSVYEVRVRARRGSEDPITEDRAIGHFRLDDGKLVHCLADGQPDPGAGPWQRVGKDGTKADDG